MSLSAGTATFQIDIANTTSKPNMAPLADRNIDAIVLTTNLSDIKMRAANEQGSVPMDGLFTQRNKVFMKVTNHGNRDMLLTVPFCACKLASLFSLPAACLLPAACGCGCAMVECSSRRPRT